MEKYQAFAISSILFILANNFYLLSSNPYLPRLFDYIAYGFFIFGIFKLINKQR